MNDKGSILIADDEDTFLEATAELLKEEGFDCVSVRDVYQLSNALETREYDLLITDLKMPGNRVLELVEEVRETTASMPVIVVTGYPSIPSAVESVRLKVLEYFIKPIEHEKLVEAVKKGVQHKQILRAVRMAREELGERVNRLVELERTLGQLKNPELDSEAMKSLSIESDFHELRRQVDNLTKYLHETDRSSSAESNVLVDYMKLRDGVFQTIQILQKTKSSFHSKELGLLRRHLEDLLAETKVASAQKIKGKEKSS